jgi:hypothetical protein
MRSTVATYTLPVVPARSGDELCSPFPPHQTNSANVLVLDDPQATLILEKIRLAVEGGSRV